LGRPMGLCNLLAWIPEGPSSAFQKGKPNLKPGARERGCPRLHAGQRRGLAGAKEAGERPAGRRFAPGFNQTWFFHMGFGHGPRGPAPPQKLRRNPGRGSRGGIHSEKPPRTRGAPKKFSQTGNTTRSFHRVFGAWCTRWIGSGWGKRGNQGPSKGFRGHIAEKNESKRRKGVVPRPKGGCPVTPKKVENNQPGPSFGRGRGPQTFTALRGGHRGGRHPHLSELTLAGMETGWSKNGTSR